jgi:hypothetical protein
MRRILSKTHSGLVAKNSTEKPGLLKDSTRDGKEGE